VDPSGLWTKLCSRKLGDKNGPDRSVYNPISHQYLVVNNKIFSFQAGGNSFIEMIWSQGRVEIGDSSGESPNRDSCVVVLSDEYDNDVYKAIREEGEPKYNVLAYPGTLMYNLGARNCQSYARDIVFKAIIIHQIKSLFKLF